MKAIFSARFAATAIAVALMLSGSPVSAQPAATAPQASVAAPATPLSTAIAASVSLCMPQSLSLAPFEQRAATAGWTAFRSAPNGGRQWRVSDRNADSGHRLSLAAASGDAPGAPQTTHAFNCKIVLQPGAPDDFHAALAAIFGADQTEGGFFIRERDALRPLSFEEALVEFPASLGHLHAGQRMVFMQVDQREAAVVVSIDTFEPAAH